MFICVGESINIINIMGTLFWVLEESGPRVSKISLS